MKKRRKLRWASAPNPYRRAPSVIALKLRSMELRCSAFLFDLDGVLVDSRAVVERVCRLWAQRHGLDPEKVLRIAHGRRSRDTVRAAAPHLKADLEAAWIDAVELADIAGLSAVPGSSALLAALPKALGRRDVLWTPSRPTAPHSCRTADTSDHRNQRRSGAGQAGPRRLPTRSQAP